MKIFCTRRCLRQNEIERQRSTESRIRDVVARHSLSSRASCAEGIEGIGSSVADSRATLGPSMPTACATCTTALSAALSAALRVSGAERRHCRRRGSDSRRRRQCARGVGITRSRVAHRREVSREIRSGVAGRHKEAGRPVDTVALRRLALWPLRNEQRCRRRMPVSGPTCGRSMTRQVRPPPPGRRPECRRGAAG